MKNNHKGFTMLELIMVVVIIGTLASLAVPQYVNFIEKAKTAEALNFVAVIKKAQIAFASQNVNGDYAQSMEALGLDGQTPNWTIFVTSGGGSTTFYVDVIRNGGDYDGGWFYLLYNKEGGHQWVGTYPFRPKD